MNPIANHTRLIRDQAHLLGFNRIGISPAGFLEEDAPRLEKWLRSGMNGAMSYMAHHFDKRLDPRLLVPGARSVISLMLNYFPEDSAIQQQTSGEKPLISKYAYGTDYHEVIKEKLKHLIGFIHEKIGPVAARAFVDSAPVMDKAWARKSGLGWMGKNSNLISKQAGSFYFLGEVILDLDLEYDSPVADHCGSCNRCMEACPTGAITEPYLVDGSRCISYFTIELKDQIPETMKGKFEDWTFGCDICQDVCPWNRFSIPTKEIAFRPIKEILDFSWEDWQSMTETTFREIFSQSALFRPGYKGIQRNLRFVKQENKK